MSFKSGKSTLRYNPQESRHQFSHGKSLKHYRIYVLRIWKCDYWNEACSFQIACTVAPFCTQSVIPKKKKTAFVHLALCPNSYIHPNSYICFGIAVVPSSGRLNVSSQYLTHLKCFFFSFPLIYEPTNTYS